MIFEQRLVKADGKLFFDDVLAFHVLVEDANFLLADNGYLIAERMKFAGHTNPNTFFESYMLQMSTVDGQSSYWGRERCTIHLNIFRGLSLHHHPQLLQSLPAKLQADLERRPDFVALNSEIESLSAKAMAATTDNERQQAQGRRNELYW